MPLPGPPTGGLIKSIAIRRASLEDRGTKQLCLQASGLPKTPVHPCAGGLIMSASHNPGGPKEDWGIKFNYSAGEPAPERITDKIFQFTQSIKELKMADLPDIDLSKLGKQSFGDFEVRSQAVL